VRLLERLGQPPEFPLEQTCCGQMLRCTRTAATSRSISCADASRRSPRTTRSWCPRGRARPASDGRAGGRGRGARDAGRGGRGQDVRALAVPDRRARRRRRWRVLPALRRLPPDVPLGAAARGGRQAVPSAAKGARHRAGRLAPLGRVLRFRRHFRGQESRCLGGDARGQDGGGDRVRRRGPVCWRSLVLDAHRRRPRPRPRGGSDASPRGDPREHRDRVRGGPGATATETTT
jgi:hypothetical protein